MIYQETIRLSTKDNGDLHNLTDSVALIVKKAKVSTGMVNIFNIGSTAVIGAIEFEAGLKKDLPEFLNKLIPPSRDYGHEKTWHDGNGHSHLQATLLGPSMTVPITNGKLKLGTWQQIFHLECDIKPRKREIVVTVYGE